MQGVVFKIAVMVGMTAALQGAQDKLAETGPDIVVIGKRLLGVHIVYSLNGPFLRQCSVDPPTGDLSVDLASCQLVKMCVARGNTIPDNVERCLRRLLADIKAGKTVVRFNTMTKRATVDPAPRPSTEHPVSAAVEKRSAEQDHNSVERDIVVTAPNLPKPGRWMYTTMAASMSPGVPSPPPSVMGAMRGTAYRHHGSRIDACLGFGRRGFRLPRGQSCSCGQSDFSLEGVHRRPRTIARIDLGAI